MQNRLENGRNRDEEEEEYDRRAPHRNFRSSNKIENEYVKDLTTQMGLTALKKGLLEHKANVKPEVYFVG